MAPKSSTLLIEKSCNDAPAEAVRQMLDDELDHDCYPVINPASIAGVYVVRRASALLLDIVTEDMLDN